MHPYCPNLIAHYDQLTDLKDQFDGALNEAAQTGRFERVQEIRQSIESVTAAIEKLMLVFVETVEGREVTLDVHQVFQASVEFYKDHDLEEFVEGMPSSISFSETGIEHIREAMRMGFDRAMVVPGSELQNNTIDKLAELAHYDNQPYFEDRGEANDVTRATINNRVPEKSYLLLYSSEPIPQETKDLNPDQLDELFKEKNWNGMTVPEYLVLQRKEAEERDDHSFDSWSDDSSKSNWTWLLDSTIGSDKVVSASWDSGDRQVEVSWSSRDFSGPRLGARPVVVVEMI